MVNRQTFLHTNITTSVAKEYGLEEPSHVIVKGTAEGILIKKLEL